MSDGGGEAEIDAGQQLRSGLVARQNSDGAAKRETQVSGGATQNTGLLWILNFFLSDPLGLLFCFFPVIFFLLFLQLASISSVLLYAICLLLLLVPSFLFLFSLFFFLLYLSP